MRTLIIPHHTLLYLTIVALLGIPAPTTLAASPFFQGNTADRGNAPPSQNYPIAMGLTPAPVPPKVLEELQINGYAGIYVHAVTPKSHADKEGIRAGDIIQRVNDNAIRDYNDFNALMTSFKAGDTITLQLLHQGNTKEVTITMVEAPPAPALAHQPSDPHRVIPKAEPYDLATAFPAQSGIPNMPQIPHAIASHLFDNPTTAADAQQALEALAGLFSVAQTMSGSTNPATTVLQIGGMGNNASPSSTGNFSSPHSGFSSQSRIHVSDGMHDISITTSNQTGIHATVKDMQGRTLFDGPFNTPQEKALAPADVARKISSMISR